MILIAGLCADLIYEAVRAKVRIEQENAAIADCRRIARIDLNFDPKDFNEYVQRVLDEC